MTAFLFGKLPTHGDFVTRGLIPAEHRALDDWLSGSFAAARDDLSAGFDELYDRAPPWRFALVEDAGWWAGALLASIDAAGRRFPLLGGVIGAEPSQAAAIAEGVEGLLTQALVAGWSADRTVTAIGGVGGAASVPPPPGWWTLGGGEEGATWFRPTHLAERRPVALLRTMVTPG